MPNMIANFNVAEILVVEIDPESQIEMVLKILQESFSQFKLNYNMSKLNITLTKLMKELQVAKAIMKPQSTVHAVESSSRPKLKGKKLKRRGRTQQASQRVKEKSLNFSTEE